MAAPAEAAGPINHIFLSYHGSPTYTWTLRLYDKAGHQKYNASNTCTGGCKQSFSYDPATISSAYIHINTGTADQTWTFTAQTGSGHDNCILIKAGGQIVYTGDETQGCNGR